MTIEEKFAAFETELQTALSTFDHESTGAVCGELAALIESLQEPISLSRAKSFLFQLRRKRRFRMMLQIAEAVITSGQTHIQIKRQYAQGLIDLGLLSPAESFIESILDESSISKSDQLELIGLTGRIYKQRFVQSSVSNGLHREAYLRRAIDEYQKGVDLEPSSYWHAINAIALLERANRDGIKIDDAPDSKALARSVVETLTELAEESDEPPKAWELATMVEVRIALQEYAEAATATVEYCSSTGLDAFEIGSTLRQMVEIWQMNENSSPGNEILPILRAALLEKEGGSLKLKTEEVLNERVNLETAFGDNTPKTIKWYREGLERTASIARIELPDGRGIGTAGVVDGSEFFPGFEGLLLLTNAHVVSENPADSGLAPDRVRANIQGVGEVYEISRIVWSSPQKELDASFLELKTPLSVSPLPVAKSTPGMADPAPRVYVIGHPSGRDLEISLDDSRIVGANETFLHYRTPTEPGSSGSPVFEQFGWEVVALHHGGSNNVPRLDQTPGTYQANEGISITAIKEAILNEFEACRAV